MGIALAFGGVPAWVAAQDVGATLSEVRVDASAEKESATAPVVGYRARNAATARDNAAKFRNAERTAHEDAQREAARRARDAAAAAAVRGLRAEVARLNSRPDPYAPGDAGLAACAGEARAARELFSESAAAYSELAATADGLSSQVAGLQDFARTVCGARTPTIERVSHDF